jgi:hypothetical protein
MNIRKIRKKERENGMKYCSFCKPVRVHAVWRDSSLKFACDKHKDELYEETSEHFTEADYQTWMNL